VYDESELVYIESYAINRERTALVALGDPRRALRRKADLESVRSYIEYPRH